MTTGLRSRRSAATAAAALGVLLLVGSCGRPSEPSRPSQPGARPDPAPTTSAPVPTDAGAYAARLVERTNAVRADEGLPALAQSSCARDVALERAAALVGEAELEHAPMGPVIARCSPATQAAENLSRAAAEPAAVVDAWMGSYGHRANLLSATVTQLGVGCVPDDGAMLCSQVFLGP